jgi:hypothetical protein
VKTYTGQGNTGEVIYIQLEHHDGVVTVTIPAQPGCVSLHLSTLEAILKFQTPDAGLDESIRLVNEVAAIDLARRALDALDKDVVPKVFGYGKIEHKSQVVGWIVEDLKLGEQLGSAWDGLSFSDKEILLTQIAGIYTGLQKCQLPDTVHSFGGLQYDRTGALVSGPIVLNYGGPWDSLDEMYIGMFKKQLELADACPIVKGWSGPGSKKGLRESLDKFINEGISSCLAIVSNKSQTLIHGDFGKCFISMPGIPESEKLTRVRSP